MLLVDETRGRVYISGDNSVLVTNLAGVLQQTVSVADAGEMAIVGSELFVAQPVLGSVARISLTTLNVGAPLVTGLVSNRSLTYAGGALWTTSGACQTHDSVIVRVQISDGSMTTIDSPDDSPVNYYCPVVTGRDNQLVVANGLSGSTLHLFDLSSGTPVFVVAGTVAVSPADMTISAAGDALYVAAGAPYVGQTLLLPSLVRGPDLASTYYPSAIAHTPANGALVAVGNASGIPNLRLLDVSTPTTPRWALQLGDRIAPHGLAFSADGTVLYALSASGPGVTLNVIDVADPTPPSTTTTPPPTTSPPTTAPGNGSQFGEFHAVNPQRVYDSRAVGQRVSETRVQITGRGGVPVSNVSAVAVNVTVTEPEGDGYLTIYPAGQAPPNASTLNYTAGRTVPNMAIIGLGTDGQIGLFAFTPTHVIVDVVGWFGTAEAPSGTLFHPVTPFRWFDTRTGRRGDGSVQPVGPGQFVFASATGGYSPQTAGITAVAMNVTAANTTATSYLTVAPFGAPLGSSNLNWAAGDIVPNAVISKLDDAAGRVQFTNNSGSTDVIVDSSGFWDAGTSANGLRFTPIEPRRIADTRLGFLAPGSITQQSFRVAPGASISVKANADLPSGATTAVLNVTAVNPDADGFLSVFPRGVPHADGVKTSVVNFTAGAVRPNMTIMPMGAGGEIVIANGSAAAVDIIVDMTGYFGQ